MPRFWFLMLIPTRPVCQTPLNVTLTLSMYTFSHGIDYPRRPTLLRCKQVEKIIFLSRLETFCFSYRSSRLFSIDHSYFRGSIVYTKSSSSGIGRRSSPGLNSRTALFSGLCRVYELSHRRHADLSSNSILLAPADAYSVGRYFNLCPGLSLNSRHFVGSGVVGQNDTVEEWRPFCPRLFFVVLKLIF